jgi:hypothetical protein
MRAEVFQKLLGRRSQTGRRPFESAIGELIGTVAERQ